MSEKNKNIRSILTDLFRYHRNELSGRERNSFERELQKDPFAEEASEGFSMVSQQDALKDISDLQQRIRTRTARKQKLFIYRIAASIAVLMAVSALFYFIENNKTESNLADNSIQPITLEITKAQPLTEPYAKDITAEKQRMTREINADKSMSRNGLMGSPESTGSVENPNTNISRKSDTITEYKAEQFKVYVADGIMAAPGRARSKQLAAKADSQVLTKPDTSISSLSEVVVEGYGFKKTEAEETISGHTLPQPIGGRSKYNKYIQNNLQWPDSAATSQRVVVVISFLVRSDGRIDSITVVKSPGKQFSDEGIRVIKSGPAWVPAQDNGKAVEDEVRIKMVFR